MSDQTSTGGPERFADDRHFLVPGEQVHDPFARIGLVVANESAHR